MGEERRMEGMEKKERAILVGADTGEDGAGGCGYRGGIEL